MSKNPPKPNTSPEHVKETAEAFTCPSHTKARERLEADLQRAERLESISVSVRCTDLRTLLATHTQEGDGREEIEALRTEVAKMPADFPNYATWPVELPAGHWRAISLLPAPKLGEGDATADDSDDELANVADDLRVISNELWDKDEDRGRRLYELAVRIERLNTKPQEPAPGAPTHPFGLAIEARGGSIDEIAASLEAGIKAACEPAPGAPEGWRKALEELRAALEKANSDGLITDTIWVGDAPLFDFIDLALTSSSAKLGGEEAASLRTVLLIADNAVTALTADNKALAQSNRRLREGLENASGLLDTPVARRRFKGNPFYDDVVESIRAALKDSALGEDGPLHPALAPRFTVGQPVEVSTSCRYFSDWERDKLFVAAVHVTPGLVPPVYTYTTSENWPPRHDEGLTDGWSETDLSPRSALGDAQARTEGE